MSMCSILLYIAGDEEEFKEEIDRERLDHLKKVMFIFFIVAICMYVVYAVCSVLLMVVAAKGRARWAMMPWIVFTFLGLLVFIGACCATVIKFSSNWEVVILLAFALVEAAVGFYLWLCVVSLFQVPSGEGQVLTIISFKTVFSTHVLFT